MSKRWKIRKRNAAAEQEKQERLDRVSIQLEESQRRLLKDMEENPEKFMFAREAEKGGAK